MIRRPPRSTQSRLSAASDVYKRQELGPIAVLHNNAATKSADLESFFAPFEDYSLEQWRGIMSVNIDGMFLMAQAVGRHMAEQGRGGSIVQTASIYGIMAPDKRIYEGSLYLGMQIGTPAVYSASKAAVIGLTPVSYTHLRAHETVLDLVCRLLLEKKQQKKKKKKTRQKK